MIVQKITVIRRPINQLFKKSDLILQIHKKMSTRLNLKPPDSVRGLTVLDKKLFNKQIQVPIFTAKDVKVASLIPVFRKYLLKIQNFKPVECKNGNVVIHLNPELIENWGDLSDEEKGHLEQFNSSNIVKRNLDLTFENFSVESIFRAVLPEDQEGMASFTKIGHIVHVNLREHLFPFKNLIGEVLFDKIPGCRTVVNKLDGIDNTYRNFEMEILAGEEDFITEVKENKCVFKLDFSKVYWNSRLCTEHERIVEKIPPGSVVFDIFAGVGPFSIPLAKKRCKIYANDLNPECYKWLKFNSKTNKVDQSFLNIYNQDARDFILNEIKNSLPEFANNNEVYLLMNLPALALDFLKHFIGLFESPFAKSPVVIVYCFTKGEDYETLARKQLQEALGFDVDCQLFKVRTVSSLKEMVRITFELNRLLKKRKLDDSGGDDNKKCKHEEDE